ncbi:unnamed protein product [Hanseniaspora opuntiae]
MMDAHINYNKKLMAEKIKDKLFGSMVRYKNEDFQRGTSVLNPNRQSSSCITKHREDPLKDKRPSKGKLEYELRVLVGHAMWMSKSTSTAKIDDSDDSDEDEPYTYSYGVEEEELYFDDEDISRLNKRQKQYISCTDCKMSTISNNNGYQDINLMLV